MCVDVPPVQIADAIIFLLVVVLLIILFGNKYK